jgi:hypothetical protein
LLALGRHPIQNNYIKPEIGKLPRGLVDRIPLVVYIPSPPDGPSSGPITVPPEALTYPPKPKSASMPAKKPRFRFLRIKKMNIRGDKKSEAQKENEEGKDNEGPMTWEDNWEKGEYPFVRLEENRASCAICLMDFEEPKRRADSGQSPSNAVALGENAGPRSPTDNPDATSIRLENADEGAPLRLLECGHVFHVRIV